MTKLQHEDGANVRADRVTVHYDGKIRNLELDENGTVEVENKAEAEQLLESHGQFFKLDEDDEPDHVLAGKTVDEVKEYVSDVEDVERLKELRKLEDRKTGKQAIDDRIEKVQSTKEEQQEGQEQEEVEQENEENVEEDEEEDGEEAENE